MWMNCGIIPSGDHKVSRRSCLNGGGRFLYFGEVEIFFAFPDALSNIAKGEVIYMVMTWELFFLFCTLLIAVIRLIMDIYNKKR